MFLLKGLSGDFQNQMKMEVLLCASSAVSESSSVQGTQPEAISLSWHSRLHKPLCISSKDASPLPRPKSLMPIPHSQPPHTLLDFYWGSLSRIIYSDSPRRPLQFWPIFTKHSLQFQPGSISYRQKFLSFYLSYQRHTDFGELLLFSLCDLLELSLPCQLFLSLLLFLPLWIVQNVLEMTSSFQFSCLAISYARPITASFGPSLASLPSTSLAFIVLFVIGELLLISRPPHSISKELIINPQ